MTLNKGNRAAIAASGGFLNDTAGEMARVSRLTASFTSPTVAFRYSLFSIEIRILLPNAAVSVAGSICESMITKYTIIVDDKTIFTYSEKSISNSGASDPEHARAAGCPIGSSSSSMILLNAVKIVAEY